MTAGPSRGVKSEINVTPLVDVVLVLLIIFMVITPMLQRGKDVRLPQASKRENDKSDKSDPLVVSITKDREVYLESTPYKETELGDQIREELTNDPGKKILLKGDEALTVGDVRQVMEIARKSGARGISLGVEEKK